jgi:hypothetical protein
MTSRVKENFVSNTDSNTLIQNIFIGIGLMFLSLVLGGLYAFAYFYNIYAFIAFLSFIVLIYASMNLAYIMINKNLLDNVTFNIQFGSAVYIMIISFLLIIYFIIKMWRKSSILSSNEIITVNQPQYPNY